MLNFRTFHLFAAVALIMASLAGGSPVVTMSTTLDIGGSGYNAIDFFYASTPGADFTNYRLNIETTNGAYIYDPAPRQRQDAGSGSIDTFMNTVGSYLGIGDAVQIQNTYKPSGESGSPISRIDWSVFDTLAGDTNSMAGVDPAPYHLARVLIGADAQWKASFAAFDTATSGVATTYRFANDLPLGTMDLIAPPTLEPEPPIVLSPPTPPAPPLVVTQPPPAPVTTPPNEPPAPTGPPENTTPVVTVPDVPFIVLQPDLVSWDPVGEFEPSTGHLNWRSIPGYWVWYQPTILDATDGGTIVPVGIEHDGYTILTATGIAAKSEHLSDEDGRFLHQPMMNFTMFDGAVGSNASYLASAGSFGQIILPFNDAGQASSAAQFNSASEAPEPTAVLLASVALATCAQLLARRRRA
jgi:hypothetical protein